MKKIVLLMAFYFTSGFLIAQNLKGYILDEKGDPVPGATVKIEDSFLTRITNSSGEFIFNNLKGGNYRILVTFLGYENWSGQVEITDKDVNLEIRLSILENLTEEVVVKALRAGTKTPVPTTEIDKKELQKNNLGQDVPYLLSILPSVTTSSDGGLGIGYSKLSVRGTDMTRINVTVNGIPLNDAESHGVYWVDLPDLSSSVENIQIQRGVGSSTIGAGAFGANINFMTNRLQKEAYGQIAGSYGSYNSSKITVKAGTGLINKHFAFDLRLSKIHSDGFIDRARTDMQSFYSSGSYTDSKTLLKINVFSGKEETYQAWNGIPKVRLENDVEGMMRYQDHWLYSEEETQHMLNSGSRTYNIYTYKNEIDHYKQSHYQAFLSRDLNHGLFLNLAVNYTKGKGYYEQFRDDDELSDYLIEPVIIGSDSIESTDLIRRKWLDNDFYVVNLSIDYQKRNFKSVIGGSFQDYFGRHYGTVIWARYAGNSELDHQWYYNTGDKTEINLYSKLEYLFADKLNGYLDLQLRKVNYTIKGTDDNLLDIGQKHDFNFFNPKIGLNYSFDDQQSVYFTFGIANREPSRTDFKDAIGGNKPNPESMYDYELGYTYRSNGYFFNANLYYMDYENQLVKTGKINDVGDAIMVNIPESYRTGIELAFLISFNSFATWKANASFSKNKIRELTEYVDNWDDGGQNEIKLEGTDLSFSPPLIIGSELEIKPFKGFHIALISKYVGRQYIDNTSSNDRMLDAYFVNNVRLNYEILPGKFKSIEIQLILNNLFNVEYETDAWVYRYYLGGSYYNMDGYFPQAGRNIMAGLILQF